MKTKLKIFLISFLVSGGVYAVLMAGFDYYNGEQFNVLKFVAHLVFFGLSMAFYTLYTSRPKNQPNETTDKLSEAKKSHQ